MASPKNGPFVVTLNNVAVTTALALIQIKAGTTTNSSVEILKAWASQSSSTVSAQQRIQINRVSVTYTVTDFTPIKLGTGAAADATGGSSAQTGTAGTAGSGTDTDVLVADVFNVLNGWLYVPTPEERIIVPDGGFVVMKFPAAPAASTTYTAGIIFQEIG
jgi:LysM repeat protein